MTRNLSRRVELLFPVEDMVIAERILLTLKLYMTDNQKSWQLCSDGQYVKSQVNEMQVNAQEILKNLIYTDNKTFITKLKNILERE